MKKDDRNLRALLTETEGLSTVEYVILLILIAFLAIGVWRTFGQRVREQVGTGTQGIQNLNSPTT